MNIIVVSMSLADCWKFAFIRETFSCGWLYKMSSKLYILFIFFCVDMLYVVGFVQHFHPRFYNINESFCKAYFIYIYRNFLH